MWLDHATPGVAWSSNLGITPTKIVDYNITYNIAMTQNNYLPQIKPKVIFFGSFQEYSARALELILLSKLVDVVGVITTPPRPAGRNKELNYTHVHQFGLKHNLPIVTPEQLDDASLESLQQEIPSQPDLFVVAGYGKLLPEIWLKYPKIAPINIHFSLLPKYRGAMPGEWVIFMGESQTGVSLIEMSTKLDAGAIIAQAKYEIKADEDRLSLYHQLYDLGAQLFIDKLSDYLAFKSGTPRLKLTYQTKSSPPFARLINKDETKVDWHLVNTAINGQAPDIKLFSPLLTELSTKSITKTEWAAALDRMIRAFRGWPGVWTEVKINDQTKRLKLLSARLVNSKLFLDDVQIEGKTVTQFNQIRDLID